MVAQCLRSEMEGVPDGGQRSMGLNLCELLLYGVENVKDTGGNIYSGFIRDVSTVYFQRNRITSVLSFDSIYKYSIVPDWTFLLPKQIFVAIPRLQGHTSLRYSSPITSWISVLRTGLHTTYSVRHSVDSLAGLDLGHSRRTAGAIYQSQIRNVLPVRRHFPTVSPNQSKRN